VFRELIMQDKGLRYFCFLLSSNFGPVDTFRAMWDRAGQLLEPRGEEWLRAEVQRWHELGLLPQPDGKHPEWVGLLWQSPLFQALMGAISFYPEPGDRIGDFIARPVASMDEFAVRRRGYQEHIDSGRMGRGEVKYWQAVLQLQAPELYLEPFLPHGRLQGCDVACGWGRITLGLRNYVERRVVGYDLSQLSLDLMSAAAASMGLGDQVTAVRADVFDLPLGPNSTDFFLAFDIFEHMPTADVVRLLQSLLDKARVGAVLYAEIPLQNLCMPLTHQQGWDAAEVRELFCSVERDGKRWQVALHDERVLDHFSFVVI
jgi:hypothetical protein